MDKKTTDIVAYLTWVGLVIAFVMGDREQSRFHMNQSLVIWLVSMVAGAAGLFCGVCWFIGIISAIQGTEKEVPLLGQFQLLK